MAQYEIRTPNQQYSAIIERGAIGRIREFCPENSGRIFVITTRDVWELHGRAVSSALAGVSFEVIYFQGGEEHKRMSHIEDFASQMIRLGADRSSLVIAFGGGIVTDMAGFLAAIFMRGIPVIQVPTTLLAQVDAAIGGKTGVNLVAGKNLVGSFHQPLVVLIDPSVLRTLSEREYRAGLYEIIKAGVIASEPLFRLFADRQADVFAQEPQVLDQIISEAVRIKAEVVSADERESGLRRILNFGHTFGHALESETSYTRFLHGEAVSWGMRAATYLAGNLGLLDESDRVRILDVLNRYGPIPPIGPISRTDLQTRLLHDKKTVHRRIHFVLPVRIGEVTVTADVPVGAVQTAIDRALADCRGRAA